VPVAAADDDANGVYTNREQTLFKHHTYRQYTQAWAHIQGSWNRRICLVEPFSGPWHSRDHLGRDTSIFIGLTALREAARFWRERGRPFRPAAMFIDRNPEACQQREEIVRPFRGEIDIQTREGLFTDHVNDIDRFIGDSAALLFFDPIGWVGIPMAAVAALATPRLRDVMVRIESDRAHQFRGDASQAEFFGGPATETANEEALGDLYRDRLKEAAAGLRFAAHMAIPYPRMERTFFRIVTAGHHPKVLKVFRDAEAKVLNREAPRVRRAAKARAEEERTGQLGFRLEGEIDAGRRQATLQAEIASREIVRAKLAPGPSQFEAVWCEVLQYAAITRSGVVKIVLGMINAGQLRLSPPRMARGPRTVEDTDLLELVRRRPTP
jgi:three-Cys-motif partner protein